ncbi:hypothetical protein BDK51DRAFT_33418 [Blyttiomyces helicus]|uniref:Uncharacterized protein n=1 Tax=Blyttiomyces helicus TaxID=388810 RepID=A0A4P9VVG5_9FUNG|nr:hypothetical protein BDK51DRAFT_33418 [Blyttiomyces helicus]|eukprot:RKO83639.1 hypothetical protein BDK51DRAFT_33418 [Blyttiomyces helicus]
MGIPPRNLADMISSYLKPDTWHMGSREQQFQQQQETGGVPSSPRFHWHPESGSGTFLVSRRGQAASGGDDDGYSGVLGLLFALFLTTPSLGKHASDGDRHQQAGVGTMKRDKKEGSIITFFGRAPGGDIDEPALSDLTVGLEFACCLEVELRIQEGVKDTTAV